MSSTTTRSLIGSDDIHWYDGVNETFTRLTSTGGLLTLNAIGPAVDILEAYGGGTGYTMATLKLALNAIGTTNHRNILLRPGTWSITSDMTIPSNITTTIMPGAIIEVATTKTLTINGPIDAGPYQIFSLKGTGFVYLTGPEDIYTEWWGAKGDGSSDDTTPFDNAMVALFAGGTIKLLKKTYVVDTLTNFANGMRIIGQSRYYTIIKSLSGNTVFEIDDLDLHSFELAHFKILGNGGTGHGFYTHTGVNGRNSYLFNVHDLWITDCGGKGIYDTNGFSQSYEDIFVTRCLDNQVEVAGGPGTTLQNIYAGEVPTAGKCGYRITGSPTLIGCNGINLGDYWGIFGATVAEDGFASYSSATLIGCNIESFEVAGILCREYSSPFIKPFTTFLAGPVAGAVKAMDIPTSPNRVPTWDGFTCTLQGAATWANGYPIHSRFGLGGVINDCQGTASVVKVAYDDTDAHVYTMPRISTAYVNTWQTAVALNGAAIGQYDTGLSYLNVDNDGAVTQVGAHAETTVISQYTTEIAAFTAGATTTWTNGIPAGSLVIGVTSRVTELIAGPTSIDIGDGTTVDAFANGTAVTKNAVTNLGSGTFTAPKIFVSGDIVITANGGVFTGGAGNGKIRLTVHYIQLAAPGS